MFNEFYNKQDSFREVYFKNMAYRFANASLSLEDIPENESDLERALNIQYQIDALEYIFSLDKDNNPMTQSSRIRNIIKLVTNNSYDDYRKSGVIVAGSSVERTPAHRIYMEMYSLLDDYNYYCSTDNDLYFDELDDNKIDKVMLEEAQFHIRFLHIHPFGDGNGRVARILLIKNLCDRGRIPCIITKDVKDEYCRYIENNDVEGLARLLQRLSKKEYEIIINLYKNLNDKNAIKENLMTSEQEKSYKKTCSNMKF